MGRQQPPEQPAGPPWYPPPAMPRKKRRGWVIVVIVSLVVTVLILAGVGYFAMNAPPAVSRERPPPPSPQPGCKTSDPSSGAFCFEATVIRVIDGDTVETDDGTYIDRIRLALVDAPELNEAGGAESRDHLVSLCLGKEALIDEDDWQVEADPYGRILAVVSCGGTNANAAMISSGHATTYYRFCSDSEFGSETWTGCP